ncbi:MULTISPECIES: glycosyltransferase family 4 protein [Brevibacillus]|jgi:glycosyltransferase involved in cell wall biosynthesis|nr:glycosyltransferase [Brevibacillus borstelensis]MBE5394872.1 glycosyltransferase [Brevibacillus borstelensis]MCM3471528.1 glycosyltransferase [Brevibacillus borstelensis]MCM3559137.1 glycosyltransferase [Brevibacillus borstelensis]MCM3590608.1 glycosyltransferase [Brevibacillus borstelensis]MCM3622408.1 glycosyltransferase [Brevibacillus borstelensis]
MSMQIAFYYDSSFDWNDNDLENKGVGGSQSTLIRMTRELAKRHEVTVFNSTTKEGRYNGVTYRNYQTYRSDQFWDVFVSYRCALPSSGVNAACKLHWCIDPGDNTVEKDLPFIDKVITISPFHTKMMSNIFHIDKSKIYEARLGIQTEDYWDCLPKTKNKLIFCSAPDRGLRHVPQIFSLIKKKIPDVSLVITMDYSLWGFKPETEPYRELFKGMEGVTYLGKVSQQQLVHEQKTSMIHIYPCDGPYEMFCLASMECQAAGTPTIATNQGALSTTVQDGKTGKLIYTLPDYDSCFYQTFADTVTTLLSDPIEWQRMSTYARERAFVHYSLKGLVLELEKRFTDWSR